jgi:hypothetical protein
MSPVPIPAAILVAPWRQAVVNFHIGLVKHQKYEEHHNKNRNYNYYLHHHHRSGWNPSPFKAGRAKSMLEILRDSLPP